MPKHDPPKYPYVTGTSVIGIKYKDGILVAADMGSSYGSTLRYKSVERIIPVGKHSLLGSSAIYISINSLYDNMWDDDNSLGPKVVHNYLNRIMYNRRNKFNPLWNALVLGGVKNGKKYLGMVRGLSFEEAVKLLEKCMCVCLLRDRSAINKFQVCSFRHKFQIHGMHSACFAS
ncbi:Proteasome subunit beta type-4 [Acorus calamus]|uniref:Proteasome subunit beta type-4 n=1 Tax=Acorus calamus TaxID=4465 RepID=A0AAV9DBE7_ACOCL|nr:Proteasome subunit beta type-4 [Acorus calamus]